MRVLIVEDEPAYVDALQVALEVEGIDAASVGDGREAIEAFHSGEFDVVLLDLMLPSLSGLDVLRAIRADATTPVIVVSAKDGESDVVAALELGADDYLTKPYSARELIARMRAVGRRSGAHRDGRDPEIMTLGNVSLDTGRYQLVVGERTFDLPRKEFEVMSMLMDRASRVVTRDWLLDQEWGMGWGDTKSLDQHIRRLRRKLETHEGTPRIVTIRGVGYRLEE
jgi:two-component system response regulator RegX3